MQTPASKPKRVPICLVITSSVKDALVTLTQTGRRRVNEVELSRFGEHGEGLTVAGSSHGPRNALWRRDQRDATGADKGCEDDWDESFAQL